MGKIAKVFLFLIFVIALVLPPLAVRVRDTIDSQQRRIEELEKELKETQEQLAEAREEIRSLEAQLKEEKERRAAVERELRATKEKLERTESDLRNVKAELKETKSNWNDAVAKNRQYLAEIAALEEKNASLKKEVGEKTKEIEKLKKELGNLPEEARGEKQRQEVSGQGMVVGTYGDKYLTMVFRGDLIKSPIQVYVRRRGRVTGKANLRQLSNPTIVIQAEDDQILGKISEGDVVRLKGNAFIKPRMLEGQVDEISPQDYLSIEVSEESYAIKNPVFTVFKDQKAIGEIKAGKIVSLMVVGELGEMEKGTKVGTNDYLVTPR